MARSSSGIASSIDPVISLHQARKRVEARFGIAAACSSMRPLLAYAIIPIARKLWL
jgi:hypothetical protein